MVHNTSSAPALLAMTADGYRHHRERTTSGSWVQDKNFYVLSLLQEDPVRAELASHPALAALTRRFGASRTAGEIMFTSDEIEAVRGILTSMCAASPDVRSMVRDLLRPSGTYMLSSSRDDAGLLGDAWVEAARGVNRTISRFAIEVDSLYGAIDTPSYDLDSPAYRRMVVDLIGVVAHSIADRQTLFFEATLAVALGLLRLNRRDEAGRHEPLGLGENRASMARMSALSIAEWESFRYGALLVLGIGAEDPGTAISPESRENCEAAVALFADGSAPFVIVSGGYVHPKQTIFCEAIEMKRELMLVYGLSEDAILVEPHARHTMTNHRNAARLLFMGGAPMEKPGLTVAGRVHLDVMLSDDYQRATDEILRYRPASFGARISDVAVEFVPSSTSLHIDPNDPLDP